MPTQLKKTSTNNSGSTKMLFEIGGRMKSAIVKDGLIIWSLGYQIMFKLS